MELNKKSWHSKLHNYCYKEWKGLPSDFCSYFWKIILGIILFIPSLPFGWLLDRKMYDTSIIQRILVNIVSFFGLIIIGFGCIYLPIFKQDYDVLIPMGISVGIISIVIGILYVINNTSIFDRKTKKEKTPNILIEYIKATKGKYCPKINWK